MLIGDDPEVQIIETKNDLSRSHAVLAQVLVDKVIKDNINKPARSLGEVTLLVINREDPDIYSLNRSIGKEWRINPPLFFAASVYVSVNVRISL